MIMLIIWPISQLLQCMNCVGNDVASLSISTTSIRRHGLLLAKYIQNKTMEKMAKVASISVMFDEASDIQMHKHLNIFVNVSTSTELLKCTTTIT